MADVDLLFRQAPLSQPADLLLGEVESFPEYELTLAGTLPGLTVAALLAPPCDVTLAATLPGLTVEALCAPPTEVTLDTALPGLSVLMEVVYVAPVTMSATLPGLTVSMDALYRSETARPTVSRATTDWQTGARTQQGDVLRHQDSARLRVTKGTPWQSGAPAQQSANPNHRNGMRLRTTALPEHRDAQPLGARLNSAYANMLRTMRPLLNSGFQEAAGHRNLLRTDWQERYRRPRPALDSSWGQAQRLLNRIADEFAIAIPSGKGWDSRYRNAIRPPAGIHAPHVPPERQPCYVPPLGSAVPLRFSGPRGDTNLVFVCEQHPRAPGSTTVVPVRRVYIVINSATLRRVVGDIALPTFSMSMSLDVDSWTWGFNASLPASTLDALMPDEDGTPVELEATINGTSYRLLADKVSRERTFNQSSIRISGRGKNAVLSAPIAPIMSFSNSIDRTAQQLMDDALMFNGVPIGWYTDWQIDDWLVPAGAWSKQGAYIDALSAIAGAAGAYLQPHATDNVMRVLARYPVAPWDWGDVTPDFELPSSVTTREGIEWLDKAQYNRVYVSGTSAGVLGQVTRTGSAGDILAPMVTDALITQEAAARQRGNAVLSDTGRQAMVGLRTPVLSETGIILPGNFVSYVDGSDTKVGIVRSTNVDVGLPEVWQSLILETHS